MKNNGFSLVELLVTMAIVSILVTIGVSTQNTSSTNSQAKLDLLSVLQLPSSIENYFSIHYSYPQNLGQVLYSKDGVFFTPKKYYLIDYRLDSDSSYTITARLNENRTLTGTVKCYLMTINHAGKLTAQDKSGKNISSQCWKK